ncbi:uncharacterized protein LOC119720999 [Patiria miniata]|uniref:Ubiquitin-like domain-containing protein n=1 Tax=Patiria miniata TaxID=46514 RepID=A0A913Z4Y7_PATMI|nr:uncharacterized protein LOC119720999 [Patiria miniata]
MFDEFLLCSNCHFLISSSSQGCKTDKIQIFISTPLASTISLQLHPSTSTSDLKGLLQDKLGIDPEKQHLFTRKGLELCDALSITDHGIEHDATIELRLVSGLLGGRKKNKKSGKGQKPEQTQSSQQPVVPAAEETPLVPQTSSEGAASAASSTPVKASTVASIGVINIQNVTNSPIILGNVSSSSFKYPQMTSAIDVTCKENPHEGMNAQLFEMLKRTVKQYGKTHIMDLVVNVFKECDSELQEATMGSVKFILRVRSRGGLDKLWAMYTTGELAKRLTEILITNELTTEDKSDMAIKVTILERDYRECCKFFDKMQKGKMPLEKIAMTISG